MQLCSRKSRCLESGLYHFSPKVFVFEGECLLIMFDDNKFSYVEFKMFIGGLSVRMDYSLDYGLVKQDCITGALVWV